MAHWIAIGVGIFFALIALAALYDLVQPHHSINRTKPLIGHLRFLMEDIRPIVRQDLLAGEREERPFDRNERNAVYRMAKGLDDTSAFGSKRDYSSQGEIHILHSAFPVPEATYPDIDRAIVIGPTRRTPYVCPSFLNISGMSRGALSSRAVKALSMGARLGDIHMLTGEGGLAPEHLEGNCRIIAQIGPAKFGYRTPTGELDMKRVKEVAAIERVVAFEIKWAQGAKPGLGGTLLGSKVTTEIAAIRQIPVGQDCHSPNAWAEFHDAEGAARFVAMLQEETGKPVGIKLVGGREQDIIEIARVKRDLGIGPDFITLDGGEGGTGAASQSYMDHVGLPLFHALPMVDNVLRKYRVRDEIVLIVSGGMSSKADITVALALGADLVNMARAFMMSLGCIQAGTCHTGFCPTGVTSNHWWLDRGLVPHEKKVRVMRFVQAHRKGLVSMLRTTGKRYPWELTRDDVSVVTGPFQSKTLSQLAPYPPEANGPRHPVTAPTPRLSAAEIASRDFELAVSNTKGVFSYLMSKFKMKFGRKTTTAPKMLTETAPVLVQIASIPVRKRDSGTTQNS